MEDILTSNVFGALKYMKSQQALLSFLAQAQEPDTKEQPLLWLKDIDEAKVKYCFWPWWQEPDCIGCEPDVVLGIDCHGGQKLLILVEAKFHSGKSSEEDEKEEHPTDQLAREWGNLIQRATKENKEPVLIYLTAGFGCPTDAIHVSKKSFEKKPVGQSARWPFTCLWLSWRHLPTILKSNGNPILQDLLAVLKRLGLTFFAGFSEVKYPGPIGWSFSRGFDWTISTPVRAMTWRFET